MTEDLYRLVYCSRSTLESACGNDLTQILAVSRGNNARFNVTGALLFSAGCFAQVLEGPLAAIERTFERIQRDPRHADITVLQVERSPVRSFGEWAMASAGRAAGAHPLSGLTLQRAFTAPCGEGAQEILSTLEALVRSEDAAAAADLLAG